MSPISSLSNNVRRLRLRQAIFGIGLLKCISVKLKEKWAAFTTRLVNARRKTVRWIRSFLYKFNLVRVLSLGKHTDIPQRNIALGYLIYSIIGFLLLLLPFSHKISCGPLNDLFTAVSALSTTGLTTVEMSRTYTVFGQLVILALIQIGGMGYMTLSSYIFYRLTHHCAKVSNDILSTSVAAPSGMSIRTLMSNIVLFTFIFESIGFILLYIFLLPTGVERPMWDAFFLSISSFCTAGFSPIEGSLCSLRTNIPINIVIAMLSYAGGMGFIVVTDCLQKLRDRSHKVTFTTKVILFVTSLLTLIGTISVAVSTYIYSDGVGDCILTSFFQTMSAMTTVGFNTIDLSELNLFTILIITLVMFIGASPSGTGGGVKSTSVSAIYAFVKSQMRPHSGVTICGRKLPYYRIDSALTNLVLYSCILGAGIMMLSITESQPLQALLFEAASALGTVGLSLGITSSLTAAGKLIIISLMYIGRIGVITFTAALIYKIKSSDSKPKADDLAI